MKNPDLNALAPGGWCRCAGQKNYGSMSSCAAPSQLAYQFTRQPETDSEAYGMPRPTFDAWQCMGGAGTIYFDLVTSDDPGTLLFINGMGELDGGPYSNVFASYKCQGLPLTHLYIATWNNPNTSQLETIAYIALLADVTATNSGDWRKLQRLVMVWGSYPYAGNTCDIGDYTAWHAPQPVGTPISLGCPSMGKPFLQYQSPPKLTLHEAMFAKEPCIGGGDIVFKFSGSRGYDGWFDEEQTDQIVAASGSENSTSHNTDYLTKLSKLSIQKFCHCSEIMEDEFIHQSSGGTKWGVPSGIVLTPGGFFDLIEQSRSWSYTVREYSALNGLDISLSLIEPTRSKPPSFSYGSNAIEVTSTYYQCDGNGGIQATESTMNVYGWATLHACSDANLYLHPQNSSYVDYWHQSPCRYAEGGISIGEGGPYWMFGHDSTCAYGDRLVDVPGLPAKFGISPGAKCKGMSLGGILLNRQFPLASASLNLDPS